MTGVAGGEAGIGVAGAEVLCFEEKLYFCGAGIIKFTSAGRGFPVEDEADAKHFGLVPADGLGAAKGSTAAFDGLEDAGG